MSVYPSLSHCYRAEPDLTVEDYYRRRTPAGKLAGNPLQNLADARLSDVADAEHLIRVYWRMARRGGQAPGPDGIRFSDLSRMEVAWLMREIAKMIRSGEYRPGKTRPVRVLKRSGKGYRTLSISNTVDRVVSGALHAVLTPVWDRMFLDGSMGFRTGRGAWRMFAELEYRMQQESRWVLVSDDIENAFPSVVIDDVVGDHELYLTDPDLLGFVELMLRGSQGPEHEVGIEQGAAYCPTALNVRLHHVHDLALDRDLGFPHWLRYADNLLYLCQSVQEGHQVLSMVSGLLQPAGLRLKDVDKPADLQQGDTAQILGLQLSQLDGELTYSLGADTFSHLDQNLARTHRTPNPLVAARAVLAGWIGAYGPALQTQTDATDEQLLSLLTQHSYQEVATHQLLGQLQWDAWRTWRRYRLKVHRALQQRQHAAAPLAAM